MRSKGLIVVLSFILAIALLAVVPASVKAADGNEWTVMPSPTTEDLFRVWGFSANNVFAVGDNGTIIHYDGTKWTTMDSPTKESFKGIWGSSPDNVYAVDDELVEGDAHNAIYHYNGTSWEVMLRDVEIYLLTDIWGSASDNILAVGGGGKILRYNGEWLRETHPFGNRMLRSIWGSGPNDIFVVGETSEAYSTILHYNGESWSVPEQTPATFKRHLRDVWGSSPTDVYAVGYKWKGNKDKGGTILHYDGLDWTATDLDDIVRLRGIWGNSPTDIYVVGGTAVTEGSDADNGTILHYDGASWSPMTSPVPETPLHSVWGSSPNNIFAVGKDGTILHYGAAPPPDYTLTTTVDPAGSGTVELNPPGGTYPAGTEVTLTANPAAGYDFDHWSGDLTGSNNPATIIMDANKNVTAHFAPALPDLTIKEINTPATIYAGSPAVVTATVYNGGSSDAGSFNVTVYAGETLVETKTIASLAAGVSTNLEFTWTPAVAGEVTLKVIADVNNQIPEADETNNELTKMVTVVEEAQIVPDVNNDDQVNVLDMVLIGQKWGQTGTPGWISEDVNRDGKIDVLDMILVGQHWTG